MELGSPRATQRLKIQTLLRRSSMATAEDVQQIPGVTGPLRKRSRTDQPSISTPVWYQRHFGANGDGCASDRRKCKFCSFAAKAALGSNPNHLGAHLLTAACSYLMSAEAMADAANVHIVRQHLEARQGEAGTSLEVDNHNVDRLLLEWLLHDGMPLTIVESGAFLEFVRALKPDWTPPSRYLLSHRMMLDVYQGVITAVVERVETQPFVAMSVDGWSKDMGSAHCLAWCAAWWGQAYLVDCINTEANSVTAAYLLSKFEETMTKHNLEGKVCALVTDTPSTHKALWRLVEEKYPKVLGVPCQMHVQDLYLKDLLTLELVIKHCEVVRDIIKYYTLSSCLAQQLEVFQNLHNIRKGLELSGGVRMHSCSSMLSSLQVNKPALCSAVTDASFLRPGLTAAQQQRAGSIRAIVLSPNFWAENQVLVHTMRPIVHLQIDLQSDNANIADAYYAAANERVFSAFSHVWSDKRASLILGRMWVMAYIYFNKRVLERKPKTLSDADWEEYERWMRKTPQDQDQN
ncbi:hypothetical protein QJQ45_008101 [Haematococcus lacustris]|nr:hypothetical protein QJQ45_008101 [Haematococcus lacustris]